MKKIILNQTYGTLTNMMGGGHEEQELSSYTLFLLFPYTTYPSEPKLTVK